MNAETYCWGVSTHILLFHSPVGSKSPPPPPRCCRGSAMQECSFGRGNCGESLMLCHVERDTPEVWYLPLARSGDDTSPRPGYRWEASLSGGSDSCSAASVCWYPGLHEDSREEGAQRKSHVCSITSMLKGDRHSREHIVRAEHLKRDLQFGWRRWTEQHNVHSHGKMPPMGKHRSYVLSGTVICGVQ